MKATSKYQTNRYSSAEELIEELDNISFVTDVAGTSVFASSDVIEKNRKRMAAEAAEEEETEVKRKKKKKKGKRNAIIAAVIILLLAAGGWFTAWKMGVFSSTKPAPDLRGLSIEEATAKAQEEGFSIKQGKDIYSNDYPEGKVCTQDPEPGQEAPKEGTITVHVSKGSKEGVVPNVVGMKQEDVEEDLKEYGYLLGNVKMVTDPAEEGTVLAQDPERGTPLDKESKINIEVSDGKGTEKGTVPSVTGLSLEDAKKRIKEEGFRVGRVDYDWDNSIDKGYVIYQQYQANSLLDKGTSIDIQVSSGPEPAPVMPEETTPAEQPAEEQPAETPAG